MEKLSEDERELLYRLINNGIGVTLAEIDEDCLEKDVPTKYGIVQLFVNLEKKGMIFGKEQEGGNWFVDMWGMLNMSEPVLTQAGRDYLAWEEQQALLTQQPAGIGENHQPERGLAGDSFAVSDSLQELQKHILERGGEEQGELGELLVELQEMVENMEQTRHIIKNSGIVRRLGKYRDKHGWFNEKVLNILGQTVLKITAGG